MAAKDRKGVQVHAEARRTRRERVKDEGASLSSFIPPPSSFFVFLCRHKFCCVPMPYLIPYALNPT